MRRRSETARRWTAQAERAGARGEGGGDAAAAHDPEGLLDELTERISLRMRDELGRLAPRQQTDLADKIEDYLASELCHTHTCQARARARARTRRLVARAAASAAAASRRAFFCIPLCNRALSSSPALSLRSAMR